MLISSLLIFATLTASALVAAWPLVFSRMLRPAMQGTCGMLCVLGGAGGFFALASGLTGGIVGNVALAAESDAAAETESASFASAKGEPAATSPAVSSTDSHSTSLNSLPLDLSEDVVIPPGRPSWVEANAVREGSVHSTAVCSGPFKRDSDARRALDEQLERETAAYIAETLGSKLAPRFIRYDASAIRTQLVKGNTYHETIESPTVGSMEQYHALLEFPQGFQDRIRHDWEQVIAKWRLAQLGLVASGAILLLGTVFGYFRVDNATRGYYTGRLQFLSAAAILAIVGAGVVLGRWIHWL
ncbi:MAG TPA: hypothetical protein VMP01_12210 [Pirellulaceae bacterium]|nr:hypothetical protein [Pirellulaceae bacterium]